MIKKKKENKITRMGCHFEFPQENLICGRVQIKMEVKKHKISKIKTKRNCEKYFFFQLR